MNRKQRRARLKHSSSSDVGRSGSTGDQISQLFFEAAECERARKFDDAARAYKRVLLLKPNHAEACNNLARVRQTQGKTKEASTFYARALALMPQLLEQYAGIRATLIALLPPLSEALQRQAAAWPKRLTEVELRQPDEVAKHIGLAQFRKTGQIGAAQFRAENFGPARPLAFARSGIGPTPSRRGQFKNKRHARPAFDAIGSGALRGLCNHR